MANTLSGIDGYFHNDMYMIVRFKNGKAYRYDFLDHDKLQQMIDLAKSGTGLNTFINKNPEIRKQGYLVKTTTDVSFISY